MSLIRLSKRLSLILRHRPADFGLVLDAGGWVALDALAAACRVTEAEVREVVRTSDKQRFALSDDGLRIRAQQGHSVEVALAYEPMAPPAVLYHGTVARFVAAILAQGLRRGQRHHVHLSATVETARLVAARRGRPVILRVRAADLAAAGHVFYCTPNGVWLTEHVPAAFLEVAA